MVHADPGHSNPFWRQLYGILQINRRIGRLLIRIAALPVGRIALMPFRAGDKLLIRRQSPSVLIVHPLQTRMELATEKHGFIMIEITQIPRQARIFPEPIRQRNIVENLILTRRLEHAGPPISRLTAIHRAVAVTQCQRLRVIQSLNKVQRSSVIAVIAVRHAHAVSLPVLIIKISALLQSSRCRPAETI